MREAVRKTVPAQIKTHFSFRSCAKRETVLGLQREKGANASISVRVGPCTRGYPGFLLSNTNRMASRIVFRGKARCRSRRCLLSDLRTRQRQAKRLRAETAATAYSTIATGQAKMSVDRDDQPGHGTQVHRVGALFSLESKNRFSFRARSKREMVLDLRRNRLANSFPRSPLRLALLGTSPCRGGNGETDCRGP